MRKVTCTREGCVLGPKMGKNTQVGAGVLRLGQSYLVPFSSCTSAPSTSGVKPSQLKKPQQKPQKGRGVLQNTESRQVSFQPVKSVAKKHKVVKSRVSKSKNTQTGKGASKSRKRHIVISSLDLTGSKRRCVRAKIRKSKPVKKVTSKFAK